MKYSWIRKCIAMVTILSISVGVSYCNDSQDLVVHASSQVMDYSRTKEFAQVKAELLVTGYGNTSVQYALIDQGEVKITGQAGVYSMNQSVVLNEKHMYGIGSISKMYTAASVMNLVEEGKIHLDNPVVDYIKDFTMVDSRYKNITVRMLLNHSSGIMGSSFQNGFLLNDNDIIYHDTFLKKLAKQKLKSNPGNFSVYSNDGFTLAEILVERVSKKSFSTYIRDMFTKPLQLSNTHTPQDKFNKTLLTKTYYPGYKMDYPVDTVNAIGTGGIYSTAQELCQFSTTFMKDSNGILDKESLVAMENHEYERGIWPEGKDSGLAYGLGWDSVDLFPFNQYNIKALTKGGDTYFYHSSLIVLPEHNMAVAVLSSGGASSYNQIMGTEILLTALEEKKIIESVKEDKSYESPVPVSIPTDVEQYAGYYGTLGGVINVEFNQNNELVLWNPLLSREYSQKFIHVGNGLFVNAVGKNYAIVEFVKESNGKVYMKNQNYNTLPGLGQTASNYYVGQKLDNHSISKSVKEAWLARSKERFFVVNEKYTSQSYPTSLVMTSFTLIDDIPYIGGVKIIDKNYGKNILEIPGMYGRDLVDYRFMIKNKKEYLEAGDSLYISSKGISHLSNKKHSIKIDMDGYGKWYKVPQTLVGKTMVVSIPKNGAYAVYDANGNCLRYSYMDKKKKTDLPKGGYVLFAAEKGTKFNVFFE